VSVRSANRSARIAEAALQEQRRPLFGPSRFGDPTQKINFVEGHWVKAEGGRAVAEHVDGVVYLAANLRNVGSGIGVCQRWAVMAGTEAARTMRSHMPEHEFRMQSRDLYIPAGDVGMWQGALRHPDDPVRAALVDAIENGQLILLELLYSDLVGGQRTITRFALLPVEDHWLLSMSRHWYLDWSGPRPESEARAAQDVIFADQAARESSAAGIETPAAVVDEQ
jgi:hypothetical protein